MPREIPPPGPYTAARFARWDNNNFISGFVIYLSGDANDEPAAYHDDAGAEPRRQHGRPARGHAALCKASAAPGCTVSMIHMG